MIHCDGNTNIPDGLVVYDRGIKERDKRLFVVLDRLSEVGVTVNGVKCWFGLVVCRLPYRQGRSKRLPAVMQNCLRAC